MAAAALQTANETPKIALAPSLDLLGVPSSLRRKLSISVCWVISKLACKSIPNFVNAMDGTSARTKIPPAKTHIPNKKYLPSIIQER